MSMSADVISLTSAPALGPALQVVGGPDANKSFPISRPIFMVGRMVCCELKLKHTSVALIHCVFLHTPEGLVVRDCNTETGTHVNGVLIIEQLLKDKDALKIGPFNFLVQVPSGWPAAVASTTQNGGSKLDGASGDVLKQLREERRKTQAFVDEQLTGIRTAREALKVEELAVEERLQAGEAQLATRERELAELRKDLEERETRLTETQKAWAQEKEQREQEEQAWCSRQQEAEVLLQKTKAEHDALEEHFNHVREAITDLRKEQEHFFLEKDELQAWLDEHRGMAKAFTQEREALAQEKARFEQEAASFRHDTQNLAQQRAEYEAAVQALTVKQNTLEVARGEFEQERASFAETLLQLQTQKEELEARQTQLTAAMAEWEQRRESLEQELATWAEEQRRSITEEIETERANRLKDIAAQETQTLAELLEWLVQTENFLASSLDAARESRSTLLEKRSRIVRHDRRTES